MSAFPIETWSAAQPPSSVRPADGFAAIVPSERLAARIDVTLAAGGRVLAAVDGGVLVGYASVLRPLPVRWLGQPVARPWDGLEGVLELGAIEVARPFRRGGIGRRLAAAIATLPRIEEHVVFGVAAAHHWDLAWSSLPPFVHRAELEATLRHGGLVPLPTTDPEIATHPANALFVRVGARAAPGVRAAFDRARLAA
jgi:acetoin utilization protein AcuA